VHDPHVKDRLQHDFRYYLGQMYYDAVTYGPEELALTERVVARANNYESKDERASPSLSFPFLSTSIMGTRLTSCCCPQSSRTSTGSTNGAT